MKEDFYTNMKLINLIQIKNVFKPDMKFEDIQVSYKIIKFLKSIENDTDFYNKKIAEITQECVEKDGDEIRTTDNGSPILSEEKIQEWENRVNDLGNIEVEVNLPAFKLEDFNQCSLTLKELSILEPLISE